MPYLTNFVKPIPTMARLARCERIYHGDHWQDVPETHKGEPRPVTPVIQSTVENIRADLMDSFPEAIITCRRPRV